MARRSLIFVAAGALLAAGCVGAAPPVKAPPPPPPPPPPTQACGLGFANAAQYEDSFFTLAHTGTGWITADGFAPVQVPDGSILWWMSDTMTGTPNPDNSVSDNGNSHNTIVQQSGGCLTPTFGNPEVIPGSAVWHWPGSAVVVGNTVKVFSFKLVSAPGPPGFEWSVIGVSITTFALPSLQRIGGPSDLPLLNNQESGGANIPFGIRSVYKASEGMVYLYGETGSLFTARTWVARVPSGQETNVGAWQFLSDASTGTWSPNFGDAKPMKFMKSDGTTEDGPPIAQLSVVPYGSRYLAGAFIWDTITPEMGAWIANNPWGPWVKRPSDVAVFSKRTNEQIGYDARIAQLPGAGWTVVYSANDPFHLGQDFTLYRGQFAPPNGLPPP